MKSLNLLKKKKINQKKLLQLID